MSKIEDEFEICLTGNCMVCGRLAHMQSPRIAELKWCTSHFIEAVVQRAEHEAARRGHEEEIELLVSHIHGVYHRLEEALVALDVVAQRFPECSNMPVPA